MTEATAIVGIIDNYPVGGSIRVLETFLAKRASSFKSRIQLKAKGKVVNAKSILMIMSMGLVKGTEVTIFAEGPDAKEAVDALKAVIDSKFGLD